MSLHQNENVVELALARFETLLNESKPFDLEKLADELDPEYRDEAILEMIRREIDFYREKNWTYAKLSQRLTQFPNLREGIAKAIDESVSISPGNPQAASTMFTKGKFLVDAVVFAEGGQGALYKAKETELGNRQVAVKVVKDVSDRTKFRQEAEITAKLEHPGVVPVYAYSDQGTHLNEHKEIVDGRPFYAMRLVDGKPLSKAIADLHNDSTFNKSQLFGDARFIHLIECLISACHTVSYAHSVGVLHCDIKPENIMIGDFGATIVLDWGSAVSVAIPENFKPGKIRNPIPCPEWSTESLGTEAYASPEQWGEPYRLDVTSETLAENRKGLTSATDVYSLGATLYQIITGRTPIDLRDHEDRKTRDQLGSVRFANSHCPKNLESICIKAMRVQPEHRYQGPTELASDLFAWLRGDPVSTLQDTFADRCFRILNRHRTACLIVGLLGLGIISLGALIGFSQYQRQVEYANQVRIKASRDSGFTLIEEICRPLENGELQNPQELEYLARKVANHSEDATKESDPLLRARLLKLLALTKYFYSNYGEHNAAGTDEKESEKASNDLLAEAISHINESIELFQQGRSDNDEFVDGMLATAYLFGARLHAENNRRGDSTKHSGTHPGQQSDLELARSEVQEAIFYFSKQSRSSIERTFLQAEAYQLQGEVIQSQLTKEVSKENSAAYYRDAEKSFVSCIDVLNKIDSENGGFGFEQKKLRALGRANGYLGDVYRDRSDYQRALESYVKSLEFRRNVCQQDATPENKRQLARGHVNFVRLLCNEGAFQSQLDGDFDVEYLDKISPEARQNKIVEMIHHYMGHWDDLDENKAFQLIRELADSGAKPSQIEYANNLVLVAELYYQAAVQTDPPSNEYLDTSKSFVDEARQLFEALVEQEGILDRQAKGLFAHGSAISFQIANAKEGDNLQQRPTMISEILDFNDLNATNDERITQCLALVSKLTMMKGPEYVNERKILSAELNAGLSKLAFTGKNVWRIRQYLPQQSLDFFNQKVSELQQAGIAE